MALEKGVNAYVSVADADAYFADRLGGEIWLGLSEQVRAAALISATKHIDGMHWKNSAISASQPLAFPRDGTYFDNRVGAYVAMNPVPHNVEIATCETALYLVNNQSVLDGQTSVKGLKVGPIELTEISSVSQTAPMADVYLKDLKASISVRRQWWRAN